MHPLLNITVLALLSACAPITKETGGSDLAESAAPCVALAYRDADMDGFGDPLVTSCADDGLPPGYVEDDQDCDDADASAYPEAPELCYDGIDQDCDGTLDEPDWWYVDDDGDEFGSDETGAYVCSPAEGTVRAGGDCDDANPSVNPGAVEFCDDADVDEDCDGSADGPDAAGAEPWYADDDGDGYGDSADFVLSCEAPGGAVARGGDCDDSDITQYPGALELCDGEPNDCDAADTWSTASEADTASFISEDGAVVDLSDTLSRDPVELTLYTAEQSGTLRLCADPELGTTWYASIDVQSVSFNVVGLQGEELTTLSGGGQERVLSVDAGQVELSGLTIRDGYTVGAGGGVRLSGLSTLVATDSLFVDNTGLEDGGAIYDEGKGQVLLNGVTLSGNSTMGYGGAIYGYWTGITLEDVEISDNTASQLGGGIYASTYAELSATSLTIQRNLAGNSGGGIYLYAAASAHLSEDVVITENESGWGGGVSLGGYSPTMTLGSGVEVTANSATYGGGLYVKGSHLTMEEGASVSGNEAEYGGGIYVYGAGSVTLDGAYMQDNAASYSGGGMFIHYNGAAALCMGSSLISGNSVILGEGAGVTLWSDATLVGAECDLEDEVYVYALETAYDLIGTTSFHCDGEGCS